MPNISITTKGTKIRLTAQEIRQAKATASAFETLSQHHPDHKISDAVRLCCEEILYVLSNAEVDTTKAAKST